MSQDRPYYPSPNAKVSQGKLFRDPKPVDAVRWPRGHTPEQYQQARTDFESARMSAAIGGGVFPSIRSDPRSRDFVRRLDAGGVDTSSTSDIPGSRRALRGIRETSAVVSGGGMEHFLTEAAARFGLHPKQFEGIAQIQQESAFPEGAGGMLGVVSVPANDPNLDAAGRALARAEGVPYGPGVLPTSPTGRTVMAFPSLTRATRDQRMRNLLHELGHHQDFMSRPGEYVKEVADYSRVGSPPPALEGEAERFALANWKDRPGSKKAGPADDNLAYDIPDFWPSREAHAEYYRRKHGREYVPPKRGQYQQRRLF